MPDPIETLRLLVEAGIAVAGFSGVVVVFGRRAEGAWSLIERQRLEVLLSSSLSVVFLSFAALVLLHSGVDPVTTWCISSGTWSIIAVFQIALQAHRSARADPDDPELPHRAWRMTLLGLTGAMALLSVANAVFIREFWPFMAALVWLFGLSGYTFVRLLFIVGRGTPAA